MAHISIGVVTGTSTWRVKRNSLVLDYATEAAARTMAKTLANGDRIIEAPFPPPTVTAPAAEPEGLQAMTIRELTKALATGDHDDNLDVVEADERAGENRKGALKAIEDRRERLAAP